MKKFVVLDANILLDFYSFPKDELQKLVKIFDSDAVAKEVEFLITPHVLREWKKNRDKKIESVLRQFRKDLEAIKRLPIPTIIRYSNAYGEIEEARNRLKAACEAAIQSALDASLENALAADKLVAKIRESMDGSYKSKLEKLEVKAFDYAYKRAILDYPPGKPNELGDRLVWESLLLSDFLDEQELYIVTSDRDFYSPLWQRDDTDCKRVDALKNFNLGANEFLRDEWKARKKGELYVLKSILCLLEMLGAPDVQELLLSKRRSKAVKRLTHSWSFKETHSAIEQLQEFEDFTEEELTNLIEAFLENDQIYLIKNDSDVKRFSRKLMRLAEAYPGNQELQQKAKALANMFAHEHLTMQSISEDEDLPF